MIHVKVEFWPQGDETQPRMLGELFIKNVFTSKAGKFGDYTVHTARGGDEVARVYHHPCQHTFWRLIFQALFEMLNIVNYPSRHPRGKGVPI